MDNLSKTLLQDLEKIWAGLSKPAGKEDTTLHNFFDISFAGLPHKVFANEKFNQDAEVLSHRFYDQTKDDFVFLPKYHKKVPADGFPAFAGSIWSTILSNRDLDLPTQQQLLAQYRCDEIERVNSSNVAFLTCV